MRIVQLVLILLFGALAQIIFAQKSNSIVVFDSLLKNNLLEDALILAEKLEADLPKSAPNLPWASAIHRKSQCWLRMGDYPKADTLCRAAIDIAVQARETEAVEYAEILNTYAQILSSFDQLEASLTVFKQALNVAGIQHKDQFTLRMRLTRNIGHVYAYLGQMDKALDIAIGGIDIYDRDHLEKDYQCILFYKDAGTTLAEMGRFAAAKSYYLKGLEIAVEKFGDISMEHVELLHAYCWMLIKSLNYVELEPLASRLVEIQRKLPNFEKEPLAVFALQILGVTKSELGLCEEAIITFLEAKKVAKECCGLGLALRSSITDGLVQLYIDCGMPELAYTEALEANQLDQEKEQYGQQPALSELIFRANTFAQLDKIAEAKILIEKFERMVVWNDVNIQDCQHNYWLAKANVAFLENDLVTAIAFLDSTIRDMEAVSGPNARSLDLPFAEKSKMLLKLANYPAALSAIENFIRVKLVYTTAELALLTDNERVQLGNFFDIETSLLASIAWHSPELICSPQLFDLQLFKKNILASTSRKVATVVQNSSDTELVNEYHQWLEAREELSNAQQDDNSPQEQLRVLEASTEKLEKSLTRRGLSQLAAAENMTWTDIRTHLAPSEAAIDVLRFSVPGKEDGMDTVLYAFLIVRPTVKTAPELVFLENGNDLESFVAGQYQNEITRKKDISPVLYEKMWAPIAAHLQGVKTLYFSPDGIFHKINLNTLRAADGTYILDNIEIRQVTNLRYILEPTPETSGEKAGIAALFGNPAFKTGANTTVPDSTADLSARSSLMRDIAEDAKGDLHLTPLPGSEREVKSIAKKLAAKNWKPTVFTGAQATEDTLKQLKSPKVLHIATHGYFLNSEKVSGANGLASPQTGKNPALRSMLFFAGAESSLAGEKTGRNDGILTAFEAAVLNLDKTELVVLSACNTGLGKIQNGEGVLGLQRAFRIAGAKSLIMSLWEVEDVATELFMNAFYENWLAGMSKSAAFRKAQLALKAKYPQPFYWGSFILVNG